MLTGKWGYPKAFSFYPVESLYKILALFLSGFDFLCISFFSTANTYIISGNITKKDYVGNFMYSSPPQLRYPQLSYFRSNAILNWVPKNSS